MVISLHGVPAAAQCLIHKLVTTNNNTSFGKKKKKNPLFFFRNKLGEVHLWYTTHSYMLKTQYNFGHQSFDFQLAETSLF